MRVYAINTSYSVRPGVLQKTQLKEEPIAKEPLANNGAEQSPSFKGHWGKAICSFLGGTLGFIVAGPVGAAIGAGVGVATGGAYDNPPPASSDNDIDPGQASGRDSLTGI